MAFWLCNSQAECLGELFVFHQTGEARCAWNQADVLTYTGREDSVSHRIKFVEATTTLDGEYLRIKGASYFLLSPTELSTY